MFFDRNHLRRLAEKNIPNCAGFSSGFKARGRRIVNYVTVIATQKLDDKDKQVGIFFDRNRLSSHPPYADPVFPVLLLPDKALLLPEFIRRAVEDHQIALLGAGPVPVVRGLGKAIFDGCLQGFV
ncbi:MAG: hypothetical protein BECKG1743E_GA0114224_106501 [Candidatus Kentron sp. G]|nr:MAG: hypothetical protein BECKG1743E_GA0114224_106501 [Candidatus Kentron sp. G]